MVKILNLILYNDSDDFNIMQNILRKYLVTTKIKYYFYCYKENISSDYVIDDDIIFIKGRETYIPGILNKTLEAIKICKNIDFDYLIRTNISTVVNFDLLESYLNKTHIDYGSGQILNLQWFDYGCGIYDTRYFGSIYAGGTCIVMSKTSIELLISKNNEIDMTVIDDLSIGILFNRYHIYPTDMSSIKYNVSNYDSETIFYRNRRNDRIDDQKAMINVILKLINKQQTKILCAKYGDKNDGIIVTEIVENYFVDNNILCIPDHVDFNLYFGDPSVGNIKHLNIDTEKQSFIIPELRNYDIVYNL